MRGIYIYMVSAALATSLSAKAQYAWQEDENTGKLDLTHNITNMVLVRLMKRMVMQEWLWCDLCKLILLIVGLLAMAWMLPYL